MDRFIEYHKKDYKTALREIRSGCKTSHWIWYIFPQMKGLGQSAFANYFGITGINEAAAFYAEKTLGMHLREITMRWELALEPPPSHKITIVFAFGYCA